GIAPSGLAVLRHLLDQPRIVPRPLLLRQEMLVRVDEGKRADLESEVGLRLHRDSFAERVSGCPVPLACRSGRQLRCAPKLRSMNEWAAGAGLAGLDPPA